jgi:hypothetical protein
MIDCSDVEALGIKQGFEEEMPNIIYCYWHLWQNWDKNIKDKAE